MTKPIDPLLIDVPMPIETPRLRLLPVQAGMGQTVVDAVQESIEVLKPWMSWVHKPEDMTLEAREKWLREGVAKFIRREALFMVALDRQTGEYIGNTGFHDPDWDVPALTIGYWVRGRRQGQGLATEMTVGLLHYAFRALGVERVEIRHTAGNEASRRVIKKAGFTYEGTLRQDHRKPDGTLADTLIYSHIGAGNVPQLDVRW